MPYLTGNWMNQPIPGYGDVFRGSTAPVAPAPAPAPAPASVSAPAPSMGGGDYWSQLASLLGMGPPPPVFNASAMPSFMNNPMSPAGAINMAQQMFGPNAYQPANRSNPMMGVGPMSMSGNQFSGMPMFGQETQGSASGITGGGRFLTRERARELETQQRNNQRNRNPMLRSDGSPIDAAAYMRGDRPGMAPNPQGIGGTQRPQLAPPNRPASSPSANKRPSSMFGSDSMGAFGGRSGRNPSPFEASGRNPAFRNFLY